MDRFLLTDDLLTGVNDIDAQHRLLFELANRIVDPNTQQGNDESFLASLAFLAEYVQYHFAAEELAMQQSRDPNIQQHRAAHSEFRDELSGFLECSREVSSIAELRPRFEAAVLGWLFDHIRVTDKAMALHLRRHAGEKFASLPDADMLVAKGFAKSPIDLRRLVSALGRSGGC